MSKKFYEIDPLSQFQKTFILLLTLFGKLYHFMTVKLFYIYRNSLAYKKSA
jgi:hypothetical protein